MFRIMLAIPLPLLAVTIFIMRRVSSNCLMRRLTSWMVVPLPEAIRFLRLPLITEGSSRSSGVIEWIMASMPLKALSSISRFWIAFPIPGNIPIRSFTLPIFLICLIWERKSLKLNWFLAIFFWSFWASTSSNCSCALSTSETISPIPRIRSAIRSG